MGPAIESRIKPPDAEIPVLHIESKVKALNTNHQLSNVMCHLQILGSHII